MFSWFREWHREVGTELKMPLSQSSSQCESAAGENSTRGKSATFGNSVREQESPRDDSGCGESVRVAIRCKGVTADGARASHRRVLQDLPVAMKLTNADERCATGNLPKWLILARPSNATSDGPVLSSPTLGRG